MISQSIAAHVDSDDSDLWALF